MIGLARAVEALHAHFGSTVAAPYVPGKTLFRDALCDEFELSQAEAEDLCDSLERARAITFARSQDAGPVWTLDVVGVALGET
jgi:hypothetical protein